MIKIIIADDHPTVVDGLKGYFENDQHIKVVGVTTKSRDVISLIKQSGADILLLDYSFEGQETDGLDICKAIQEQKINIRIIIITSYSEPRLIHKFIESGAKGYLLKSSTRDEYIEAVKNVYLGGEIFGSKVKEILLEEKAQKKEEISFTRAELEILKLISQGLSTKDMAKKLNRTKNTIDSHRKNILLKLQIMDGENCNPSTNISHYIAKFDLIRKINLFD